MKLVAALALAVFVTGCAKGDDDGGQSHVDGNSVKANVTPKGAGMAGTSSVAPAGGKTAAAPPANN